MDTTVLQPGAGQTVVTANDRHNRHHNHHSFESIEARADFRSLTNEVERFGTVNGDRIRDTAAATAVGFGSVHDRLCDAKAGIVGALGAGFTAAALANCKTDDAIGEAKLATAVGFKDAIIAANVGFSAATVQLSTVSAAAQLEAAKNAAALSVQATANSNALSVEATKNFYALSVEAVKNASAAELRAQQIAAEASKQAAECCCELKALVLSQGEATRAQAADFRMRDLESQLARIPRGIPVTLPVGT